MRIPPSFSLLRSCPLEELSATLIEVLHIPTNAKVLHIHNNDPENLFSLSLPTRPTNSSGVAHILEHTVLCGSKKFPVKDPFFSMLRRSLHTFMNAMTGQDFTCYPASSQIEKDFYNLLEVYLDAVFFPTLDRYSFLQEGHRLEFSQKEDPNSPLLFQGVVYNEMKGAMSSVDSRLWEEFLSRLLPDLPYGVNSGGDPKEIPSLSLEELRSFHATFYHPSQCTFFFYGNFSLEKHLAFLEKHLLKGAKKAPPLPPLPKQRRFSSPLEAAAPYPVTEKGERQEIVALGWLTAPSSEVLDILGLQLLSSLLLDTDASPLKKALLDTKLCTNVQVSFDTEMSEAPFVLLLKGCEKNSAKPLLQTTLSVLQKVSFTQEEIEASLHQLEMERLEIGGGSSPFGLTLFFRSVLPMQHGADPTKTLLVYSQFAKLRQLLQDPSYLHNLLEKYILQNPHLVSLTLYPDETLSQKEKQEEEDTLRTLSKTIDKEEVLATSKQLLLHQEALEHQSLSCLPKLHLSDIPKNPQNFPLHTKDCGAFTLHSHACFTNHILYADLIYELPPVTPEELPYLSFLLRSLSELGCNGKSYLQSLQEQHAYTAGIDTLFQLHLSHDRPGTLFPTLVVRSHALQRNAHHLLPLLVHTGERPNLSESSRLEDLLQQHATMLQNKLVKYSPSYASQMALSSYSPSSWMQNHMFGIPYYQEIQRFAKDPHTLLEGLRSLAPKLLASKKPTLLLSADENLLSLVEKEDYFGIASLFSQKPLPISPPLYSPAKAPSQVRYIAATVAYTAFATRTINSTHPDSHLLFLASEILENVFLHKEIREKGGAYGANASYSPLSGNFSLSAYRDPQLARTLRHFRKALEKGASRKFLEKDVEEAKFGVIQTLDSPVPPGSRASVAYAWQRSGRTLERRKQFRDSLCSATKEQIGAAIEKHLLLAPYTTVSLLGESLYQKEKKKLATPLQPIPLLP